MKHTLPRKKVEHVTRAAEMEGSKKAEPCAEMEGLVIRMEPMKGHLCQKE